ncbi:MAG: ABC transporter substrate-binding protein [Deltaproteobacteria bacterium]|nr:MAG: ABC transporter substrate-binding protein [Deltaproteobacteria bacterium]
MKLLLSVGVAVGLLFVSTITLATDKIRISGGGITPLHAIIWVANQEGLFKKYGLEVEYLTMNSGTLGVQTLLSNESQFLFSTGALAITANVQGADLAMITGGFNLFAFKVVGRPDIKSIQDLRGKKVSISQFGSATDFAVQSSLEKFGVDPKQVTVIQLGASSNRLTALINGATEASLFTEPFATMAIKKHRMNLPLDMADAGMPYPQSCLMIKRSYLDANRDKATNVVKALIEGMFLAKRDRALTIQVIKKYIRADDEVYGIGYDYFLGKHAEGLLSMPDRKGVELVIGQLARTNPKAKGQTPETLRVFEPGLLDEIKKSGFIDKLRK